jgi:galactonate dehydratase
LHTYANGWYTETTEDLNSWAKAAERVVEDGYDAMRFDPFVNAWQRMSRGEFNRAVEWLGPSGTPSALTSTS